MLCNIPEFQAKRILTHNPQEIILKFIKRDQNLFIEPGVEIVDIIEEKEEGGLKK